MSGLTDAEREGLRLYRAIERETIAGDVDSVGPCEVAERITDVVEEIVAAREKALVEKVAQAIRDAFPLGEIEAICTLGHDCHNAARYTTGRMAARIASEQVTP